jgi:hypothetical protein
MAKAVSRIGLVFVLAIAVALIALAGTAAAFSGSSGDARCSVGGSVSDDPGFATLAPGNTVATDLGAWDKDQQAWNRCT